MPRIPFTARSLEALKPTPDAQIDYFDQSLPGFYLRISPRGRKTFRVMYRHAGRVRRMTFGTFPPLTLADAREKGKEELRKAAKGEDPATQLKFKSATRSRELHQAIDADISIVSRIIFDILC